MLCIHSSVLNILIGSWGPGVAYTFLSCDSFVYLYPTIQQNWQLQYKVPEILDLYPIKSLSSL